MPDMERGDQNPVVRGASFDSSVTGNEESVQNSDLFTLDGRPGPAPDAELGAFLDVSDVTSETSRDHESSEGEQDDLGREGYEQEQEARNSTDSPKPTTPVASAKEKSLEDRQKELEGQISELDNEIEQLETDIETNKNESEETIRSLATKLDEETGERTPLSKEDIENLSPEERSSKESAILQAEIAHKKKKKEKRKALKVAVKKRLIARRKLASNLKSQIYKETKGKITGWTAFRVGQIFKSAWTILRPGPGIKPLSKEAFSKAREGKIEAYSDFLNKVHENKKSTESYKKNRADDREANKVFKIRKKRHVITKLLNPFYSLKRVPKATASRGRRIKNASMAKTKGLKAFMEPGTGTVIDRRNAYLNAKGKYRAHKAANLANKKLKQGL